MPLVVVEGGIITCSHGGQTRLSSGSQKLTIGGHAVVTSGMEVGIAFTPVGSPPTPANPAPCPIVTPPANTPSPCTATVAATAGVSTKITVDHQGVLLDSASGNTVNAQSPGTWSVASAGQTLVQER
jgi:hypothetical protein